MPTTTAFARLTFAKSGEVFLSGDPEDAFYRVEEGLVHLVACDRRGDEATLELVGPGGTLGELSLVTRTRTQYSAMALLPTILTRVEVPLADPDSEIASAVLAVLSARVRLQQDTILRGQPRHVSSRLASLLLDLAMLLPATTGALPSIRADLTQADLARVLASSRESVSRCLSHFECEGWVRRTPGRLLITSAADLRQHAGRGARGPEREAMLRSSLHRQRALASAVGLSDPQPQDIAEERPPDPRGNP